MAATTQAQATRAAQAAQLLLQTPPGQVNEVYSDLRGLLLSEDQADLDGAGGDASAGSSHPEFKQQAFAVMQRYNADQLLTLTLPGEGRATVVADAARLGRSTDGEQQEQRYVDPRAGKSFTLDPFRLVPAEIRPLTGAEVNQGFEKVRREIDEAVAVYTSNHYPDGTSAVFTSIEPEEAADDVAESAEVELEPEAAPQAEPAAENSTEDPEPAVSASTDPAEPEQAEAEDRASATDAVEPKQSAPPPPPELKEPQGTPSYVIHIVSNRQRLSNFWSGRWRSSYVYSPSPAAADSDPSSSGDVQQKIRATVAVQVHYFENGNVQLATTVSEELPLVSSTSSSPSAGELAKAIVATISAFEKQYQEKLNDTYGELSEKGFKALRRALPITRQKVDWDKVLNYKIGSEIAK